METGRQRGGTASEPRCSGVPATKETLWLPRALKTEQVVQDVCLSCNKAVVKSRTGLGRGVLRRDLLLSSF